jgi:antitoxin component of MazEF toxin-antitoxin module
MVKTLSKIGNSQGLIFDTALMELCGLKTGDQVNITVAPGGSMVITPIRNTPPAKDVSTAIRKIAKDYRNTLRRLA